MVVRPQSFVSTNTLHALSPVRQVRAAALHSRPVVPSNKPVRSRKLHPEEFDPEELGLSVQHYPPWAVSLGEGQNDGPELHPWRVTKSLPEAYRTCSVSTDGEIAPKISSRGPVPMAGGAYLASPLEARQLIAAARSPKLWEILGLDATYADDFFRGPDYRYAVDDEGRIQDMVFIKRQRIPAPFQYAFTSQQQQPDSFSLTTATLEPNFSAQPMLGTGIPVRRSKEQSGMQANSQGKQQQQQQQKRLGDLLPMQHMQEQPMQHMEQVDDSTDEQVTGQQPVSSKTTEVGGGSTAAQKRRARYLWATSGAQDGYLDELEVSTAAAAAQGAVGNAGRGLGKRAGASRTAAAAESIHAGAADAGATGGGAAVSEAAVGGATDAQVGARAWQSRTAATSPEAKAAGPAASNADVAVPVFLHNQLNGQPQIGQLMMGQRSSTGSEGSRTGGGNAAATRRSGWVEKAHFPGTDPGADNSGVQGNFTSGPGMRGPDTGLSQASYGVRVLKAYPYCIGPRDVFHGLWELDLLQQVEFTDDLQAADLILHRRARPGEKQFAYKRLRASARRRGIPFVTVRDGDAPELAASLIPVFKLYSGLLSPREIRRVYGTDGVGSRKRRIRL